MYKNYLFPIQLFLILEKASIIFWTSKTCTPNHYSCFINSKWFYLFNNILKNELNLHRSQLTENSAIDARFINGFSSKLNVFFKKQKLIGLYVYYIHNIKMRLTVLTNSTHNYKPHLVSIDKLYLNANWLERETSEMYGLLYYWKNDQRKLLLDYSKIENPLLKDFPSEGITDTFYSLFENQIIVQKNEVVEL